MESSPEQKLQEEIGRFLEVYATLSTSGKELFEIQLAEKLNQSDEKTKELYRVLVACAKAGKKPAEVLRQMQEITGKEK